MSFGNEKYNEYALKIFPFFRPQAPNANPSTLILDAQTPHRFIAADLYLCYAIEQADSFQLIQKHHLADWDLSPELLHQQALHNLRDRAQEIMQWESHGAIGMLRLDGQLDSSLLLLDELWEQIANQWQEAPLIALPSRDLLLVSSLPQAQGIQQIRQISAQLQQQGLSPISNYFFLREGDNWRPWQHI